MEMEMEMNNSMTVNSLLMRSLESATREYARKCVSKLASEYGFPEENALKILNLEKLKLQVQEMKKRSGGKAKAKEAKTEKPEKKKAEKKARALFPLPFSKENVLETGCQGLAYNGGLFTQCPKECIASLNYCKGCQSEIDKNGSTTNGTVGQRLACELMEFKDPKGRKPVAYMKIMEKQKLTREQVETEAGKQNLKIDEMHFVAGEKKEKKKKVETVTVAVEDDLLAQLMDDLEEDSVDLETLEEPSAQQQADEKAALHSVKEAEKAEKALKKQQQADEKAAKEAEVALKKQQQADEKAAKEAEVALKKQQQADEKAAKDAEKAAKAQKIADEKAAKAQQIADEKAAKEAEKAAKAQQIADEKAAKAQQIADEKAALRSAKAQQIADEKAAKEAEKAQKIAEEKAAKEQKIAEEKALKKEEGIKKLKEQQKKATTPEKKQKEAKSAEPVAEPVVEPVAEPVVAAPKKVTVKRITIEGKQYLKTADNLLYNPETKEEMGIYDPVTNTIKALPDDSEDELSEDNMSDVE
jgi:hypothetical protein